MRTLALVIAALALVACARTHPHATTHAALAGNPYAAATERLWAEWTPLARFPANADYNASLSVAREAVRDWDDAFRDPEELLTPELRAALIERLAQHAAVRTQRTPDAYLTLAEREPPSVWLDIDESCLHSSWQTIFNEPPPRGSSRPHLKRVWDEAMNKRGGRFRAIGAGAWSADIAVRRSTDGQHWDEWMDEHDSPYETIFWRGQYALSCFAEFRAPQRPIHDVIAAHGSALAAECLVRVQTVNGVHALWNSQWHYDPHASAWVCDGMFSYSVSRTPIFN